MSQRNMDVAEDCFLDDACSVREVLDHIGGKWSMQILLATTRAPVRFTELERTIDGISRRMLTLTLRNLERDGLITRKVYPTVPPKVEYTATKTAHELSDSLCAVIDWADRHRTTLAAARQAYDREHAATDAEVAASAT